ncbi:hypothetical protein B0H11DRAFT_1924267 [Mycena galericulata]|nr:hypothetical protein B0H11DRAFT_1924267 [Mycena galericulata]
MNLVALGIIIRAAAAVSRGEKTRRRGEAEKDTPTSQYGSHTIGREKLRRERGKETGKLRSSTASERVIQKEIGREKKENMRERNEERKRRPSIRRYYTRPGRIHRDSQNEYERGGTRMNIAQGSGEQSRERDQPRA